MPLQTSGPISFSEIMIEANISSDASITALTQAIPNVDQSNPFSISEFYGTGGGTRVYFQMNYGGRSGTIYATDWDGWPVYLNTQIQITVRVWGDFGTEQNVYVTMMEDGIVEFSGNLGGQEIISSAEIINITPTSSKDQIYW